MNQFIHNLFNLRQNIQYEQVVTEIYNNVGVKGYNTWLLICACMLASIGLNTNSTAVIIGAMLISPLMSPILGIGLSFAIHDWEMLKSSARNLFIATCASLLISMLYFYVSPLKDLTDELNARTHPTLLDVGVALAGGIAGIVSMSRMDKSNAIPGVAIATALMPPLCTAGYGLSQANLSIFLGAFYLFGLNAIFISMATYFVVKYLEFPVVADLTPALKRRTLWFMFSFLLISVLPSSYFFYGLYQSNAAKATINTLVIEPIYKAGHEILKWEIEKRNNHEGNSLNIIKIYLTGNGNVSTDGLEQQYNEVLIAQNLGEYQVELVRLNLSRAELYKINTEAARNVLQAVLSEQNRADSLKRSKQLLVSGKTLHQELKTLFPEIDTVYLATVETSNHRLALVRVQKNTLPIWKAQKEIGIRNFLSQRLAGDSVRVIWE